MKNPLIDDILVSDKDLFKLSVYYKRDGHSLIVVPAINKVDLENDSDISLIEIEFKVPDWKTCRSIVRNNTYHINGVQDLDSGSFRQSLIENMAVGWNVVDSEGNKVKLDIEYLGKTRPDVVRCFIEMLERKLVEEGIYTAIVGS